ncbi:MAG: hypothetical protein AB7L09_12655 [Nitrospira sp.]
MASTTTDPTGRIDGPPSAGFGQLWWSDPFTSGFHAPGETFMLAQNLNGRFMPSKPETVVIWANHAEAEHHLAGMLLHNGYAVVERARLQQIFN